MDLCFGTYEEGLVGSEGRLHRLDTIARIGGILGLYGLIDIPFGVYEGLEPIRVLATPDVLSEECLGEGQLLRLSEAGIVVARPSCDQPRIVAVGREGKQVRWISDVVVG